MILKDAIQKVFSKPPEQSSSQEIEEVLACLRLRFGMNYRESYERVRRQFPDLEISEFDTYCRRADAYDAP